MAPVAPFCADDSDDQRSPRRSSCPNLGCTPNHHTQAEDHGRCRGETHPASPAGSALRGIQPLITLQWDRGLAPRTSIQYRFDGNAVAAPLRDILDIATRYRQVWRSASPQPEPRVRRVRASCQAAGPTSMFDSPPSASVDGINEQHDVVPVVVGSRSDQAAVFHPPSPAPLSSRPIGMPSTESP